MPNGDPAEYKFIDLIIKLSKQGRRE